MKTPSSFAALVFSVILAGGVGVAFAFCGVTVEGGIVVGATVVGATFAPSAIQIANPWDRALVLRLGRFHSLRGPGVFGIVPILDTLPYWIDTRVITTGFKAEKTLTKDTVPVDVDAVLFWKVLDPEKAALAVADYTGAIGWAAQTALRDIIGKTSSRICSKP